MIAQVIMPILIGFSSVAFGMPSLPELMALNIPHTVEKRTSFILESLESPYDQYYLDVQIGRLSHEKYMSLRQLFGNRTKVSYSSVRRYDLIDFLDPVIQALVNRTYQFKHAQINLSENAEANSEEEQVIFALNRNGIGSFTNCWGTTMEVLRQRSAAESGQVYLYWPDRWSADEFLKNDRYSRVVSDKDVRPGDVLIVSSKSQMDMVQHTALLISRNLVFEKTDVSENDPYRIAFLSDVLKKYRDLIGRDDVEFTFRRYDLSSRLFEPPTFPTNAIPESLKKEVSRQAPQMKLDQVTLGCETRMGGGCDPTYTEINTVDLLIDRATGRGKIDGERDILSRFSPL